MIQTHLGNYRPEKCSALFRTCAGLNMMIQSVLGSFLRFWENALQSFPFFSLMSNSYFRSSNNSWLAVLKRECEVRIHAANQIPCTGLRPLLCRTRIILFLLALAWIENCSGVIDIPEHARGGHVFNTTHDARPKWARSHFIQQKCDHITRASWKAGARYMSKGMLEKRQGKPAETHANGQSCRFLQRYFVDDAFWSVPYGPILLYLGSGRVDGVPTGFVRDVARNMSAKVCVCAFKLVRMCVRARVGGVFG